MKRKIIGTQEKPRMSVYRSNRAIYVQIINDSVSETLAYASSLDIEKADAKGSKFFNCTIADATIVGADVAQKALSKGIQKVVFDRGNYKFHGKVKALADAAREAGLVF